MWPSNKKHKTFKSFGRISTYFHNLEMLGLPSNIRHLTTGYKTRFNLKDYPVHHIHRNYHQLTRSKMIPKSTLTWSLYKRLRSLFTAVVPVVYADSTQPDDGKAGPLEESLPEGDKKVGDAPVPHPAISDEEVQAYIDKETGRQRLKAFFYKDDIFEDHSPELAKLVETWTLTVMSVFLVAAFYGFVRGRRDFRREAAAAKFKTHFLANRKMNDRAMIAALRDGWFWVKRIVPYSASLLLISQSISVYRNKTTPFEYMAAFGLTTGGWRFGSMGIKGFISGCVLGSVGGLVLGTAVWAGLKYAGETTEDLHFQRVRHSLEQRLVDRGESVFDR